MDFPDDLLKLQCAFFTLGRRCQELADALPDSRDLIREPVETSISREELDAKRAAWGEARAERLRVVMELNEHPWWAGQADRHMASRELQGEAKRRLGWAGE